MKRKLSIVMVFMLLVNLYTIIPAFAYWNNSVTLDHTSLTLNVGGQATLTATISPASDNSLRWGVVDVVGSNVVQLDKSKGNPVTVIAQNKGTAVVTVRHGNRSATCTVTVGSAQPPSSGNAGLSVNVVPDETKIVKPSTDPVQDNLNITLTPTGSAPTSTRPPVDIVFVLDKSGSMAYSNKIVLAKNALNNAVDFFSNAINANSNDRLGLVAFDSDVYSLVPLTTKANYGYQNIKNTVNWIYPYGGTNYSDALDKAISLFNSAPSTQSRKYIIFLTDGMPTMSSNIEQVNQTLTSGFWGSKSFNTQTTVNYDSNYDPYPSKYIISNGVPYYFPNMSFQSIENSIMDQGKERATQLAQMTIKLYSIGLGNMLPNTDMSSWSDQDAQNYMTNYLNLDYLEDLSEITGTTAQQALPNDTSSLNDIYQSLIQQIDNQTISGIQLKVKLPDHVSLGSDTNAHVENGYAILNMSDISFPADGTTPSSINDILPLLFSETGTYTFDDMTLYYKDLNGLQQTVKINPVTINVTANFVPVTGVIVDPATLNLRPSDTYTLKATVSPSNATNQNVSWSSSNSNVATVDSSGVVTGVSSGTATITATTADGGYTATSVVTVTVPVTGVTVNPPTMSLVPGATSKITATLSPSNATNQNVSWSSSNSSVATVDSNGLVTGVSGGTATITATTADGGYTATCLVKVTVPVTGITVNPTNLSLVPGATSRVVAVVSPSNATNQNVSWSSSNSNVAMVDSNGIVTARNLGTATIIASISNGNGGTFSASCNVTVGLLSDANLTNLSISEGTLAPTFNQTVLNYTDQVGNSVNSVTVTPTVSDPNATVTVNGQPVNSGQPSQAINLQVGDNQIHVVVTAQDGSKQTYSIVVTRAKSSNAGLSDLTISEGTLDPAFDSSKLNYTDQVGNSVNSVTVTPIVSDPNAMVTVNGQSVNSGQPSQVINLQVGDNQIHVVVTAQDGSTQTYSIVVTRAKSSNAGLSDLTISEGTLDPAFDSKSLYYTDEVDDNVNSVTVTPTVSDPNATVTVDGKPVNSGQPSQLINLKAGDNQIQVVVTAQDGAAKNTYYVDVIKFNFTIPFYIQPTSGTIGSGNRATKVEIGYNFSVPSGFEIARNSDGSLIFNPIFKIKTQNGYISVPLPKDGVNQESTHVFKYLKSSTGYSQKFLGQGEVDVILKSKITGKEYEIQFYSASKEIPILSNEQLQ
jgi:uncharacterized protein YjdB